MNQTLVISKCGDKFKIVVHDGFNHTEIYKTKEEVQSIINYMQNTIDEELLSQQIDGFMEAKAAYDKAGVELGEIRDRINSLELPLNTLLYYLFGQSMAFSFSTPMDK